MKPARKSRRGRKRKPKPHGDHHNPGATQDRILRARRAEFRRLRIEGMVPDPDQPPEEE